MLLWPFTVGLACSCCTALLECKRISFYSERWADRGVFPLMCFVISAARGGDVWGVSFVLRRRFSCWDMAVVVAQWVLPVAGIFQNSLIMRGSVKFVRSEGGKEGICPRNDYFFGYVLDLFFCELSYFFWFLDLMHVVKRNLSSIKRKRMNVKLKISSLLWTSSLCPLTFWSLFWDELLVVIKAAACNFFLC